jgi:predicted RNA-binding Zn-ribbon protein involved in translation (DUF1610 family)
MNELENKIVEFKCRMCGRYYEAKAKLCVLEKQKIDNELEMLVFDRRCPNCGCLNRRPNPDIKRRVILMQDQELGG